MKNSILKRNLTKLVILSSVIPIVFLLISSIGFLAKYSANNFSSKLQMSVKNLGLDLEDRLEFIGIEISFIANSLAKNSFAETPQLNILFNNMFIKKPNSIKSLMDSPILEDVKNIKISHKITKPKLTIINTNKIPSIFVIAPIDKQNNFVIGEINPNFLWQIQEAEFSKQAVLCVTHENQNIKCLNNFDNESFHDLPNNGDYLTATWHTFNTPSLSLPSLKVVSWADHSVIFMHNLQFILLIAITLILAIILLSFIARRLIISITTPIIKAKKHIQKYLNLSPKNTSDNELETIVNTLDFFSDELDTQYDSLSTMAKIDKIILSSLDLNSIMNTLKNRLKKLMHAKHVDIHIKSIKQINIKSHLFKTHENSNTETSFSLNKEEINVIFKHPHHLLVDTLQNNNFRYLTHTNNAVFTLIIPVFLDEKITALITLDFKEVPSYTKRALTQSRELANRFAVAIANAAKEDKLYYQAHFDSLTDLPNRLLFEERLEKAISMSKKTNHALAVLFIDLDKFKSLNDSLGHAAGDEYLRATANRIKNCLRSDDTVSRFGGDEFIVILPNAKTTSLFSQISAVAEKIQYEIAKPYSLSGNRVVLNSSIGISIYPEDADNTTDLLKAADAALYYAKAQKSGNYQFYSTDISNDAKELFLLENNLNKAIANSEFELHFQPRINVKTNKIVGAEALIRWQKNNSYISPEDFIPIAENNGLIQTVGEWILQNACSTAKKWHDMGIPIRLSVNLSAKQFQNTALITRISDILLNCKLSPTFLELELTENILMQNNIHTITSLQKLQDMGIIIAIDDFGTGYSSLSYLKDFSIDILKIDKSFIKNIHKEQINKAIVSAILTLADNLNIKTVAEGVENKQELQWLMENNCNEIQGYFFSKPLNEKSFEDYLLKNNTYPLPKTENISENQ